MYNDLQKADMWKRISAGMFDMIMVFVVILGLMLGLSSLLNFDVYWDGLQQCYAEHGVNVSLEQYQNFTPEQMESYETAMKAMARDAKFDYYFTMTTNIGLIIIIFSVLVGYTALEFVIPSIFKNGQTLGKKMFGLGVMRSDGVRMTPFMLFVRAILGKCTVETLIPILITIMILMGITGIVGVAVLAGIVVAQLILFIGNRTRTPIHDVMAHTVVIDLASQMIFETEEELISYKERLQAEKAAKADY